MNAFFHRTTAVLFACGVGFLCAPASAQAVPKKDLVINGPYYAQIVQMKDLIADVLPPPAYIIEAYLTVLQIVDALDSGLSDGGLSDAEKQGVAKFVDYGRALKDGSPGAFPGYYERIAVWKSELSEATAEDRALKQAMVVDSVEPATTFFALLDADFYKLALAGDVAGAKRVARGPLKQAYLKHRGAIDAVVSLSRGVNARIEQEVAAKLMASSADEGTLDQVLIGSPLYDKVIQMKDLVADILPPPAYIIESYLTVLELIDLAETAAADGAVDATERAAIASAVELGRQLARGDSAKGELSGYAERQAFWTSTLATTTPEEATIRNLMIKASADPAFTFFQIRDTTFTPKVLSGDVAGAKAVARSQLLSAYTSHRQSIDTLVIAANARFAAIDAKVRALLGR